MSDISNSLAPSAIVDISKSSIKESKLEKQEFGGAAYDVKSESSTSSVNDKFVPWPVICYDPSNPAWWSMLLFIFGSSMFVVSGALGMWPVANTKYFNATLCSSWLGMIGITMYQIGCWLGLIDSVNLDRKLPNWDPKKFRYFGFETKSWYWWGWALFFFGTPFFWVPALLIMPGVMPADFDYKAQWVLWDCIYYLPLTIGGVFFVTGSVCGCMAAQDGVWNNFKWKNVGWWGTVLYLLGSIAFTLNSCFGFFAYNGKEGGALVQYYGTSLSYFWGSICFDLASYMFWIDGYRADKILAMSFDPIV